MRSIPTPVIALFLGDLEMGGAERVFVTLSHQFVQRGYQVRMILAHKTGPLLNELDPAIEIVDLQAARPEQPAWLFALRTLLALRRHLRDNPPHVLLSTLTGANLMAILARPLSGRAFRLVIREAVTLSNARSRLRLQAMRWLYPHSDKIIVLTGTMKKQLSSVLKLPASQMEVIGNPLSVERITQQLEDQAEQLRSQQHAPFWLAVGRLVAQKDFNTLIEAAALLRDRNTPIRFVILGDGPLRQQLQDRIYQLHLEDWVVLAGFTANPYPWFAKASGYVLTSRWEGYPNALLEALYFNLPIVATHYDDSVSELLENPYRARHRLVPVGNPASLADAIHSLAAAPLRETETSAPPCAAMALANSIADLYLAQLFPAQS